MNSKTIVLALLACTVVIWLGIDAVLVMKGGMEASISVNIYQLGKDWPIITLLIGILMGHFFFPIVRGEQK